MTTITKPQKTKTNKKTNDAWLMKLFFIAGTFFLALNAFSAGVTFFEPSDTKPEKTIKNYFKFPQILIKPSQQNKSILPKRVEVLFTTDKSGKINFVLAKTENQFLKKEVEIEFSKLRLSSIRAEIVHSVVLNFKTL